MRVRASLLFAALLGPLFYVASVALPAPQAAAQISCISAQKSLFDGYYTTGVDDSGRNFIGTSADEVNNTAPICTTGSTNPASNFIFVWNMVHDNNSAPGGTTNNYAQMGFFEGYGQCMYFADEYGYYPNTPLRVVHTEYGCLTPNSVNRYWVQYGANDPCTGHSDMRLNVDTTIMNCTPFDPATAWPYGYGHWLTEFNGETKYLGSNVPNSQFFSMEVQQNNGNFTNILPNTYNSCPWPVRYINSGGPNGTDSFGIITSGSSDAYNC